MGQPKSRVRSEQGIVRGRECALSARDVAANPQPLYLTNVFATSQTLLADLYMFVVTLDEDRVWQEYERAHPDAESMPMSQLLHASAEIAVPGQVEPVPKSTRGDEDTPPQKAKTVAAPARAAGLAAKFVSATPQRASGD